MVTTKETTKRMLFVPAYVSTKEFQKFSSLGRTFKQLTASELAAAGFTHSNSYILFSSLKALKIYDLEGNLLQRDDLVDLGSKDQNIRRDAYERIVKRAYSDLLEKYSPETVTLENVQNYFQRKGAAHSVSIKAARLFLWFLEQAGLRKAEETSAPEIDTTAIQKPRKVTKRGSSDTSDKSTSIREAPLSNKQRLLDVILETINSYNGLPPVELVKQARELIEEIDLESGKIHNASQATELSSSRENGDE